MSIIVSVAAALETGELAGRKALATSIRAPALRTGRFRFLLLLLPVAEPGMSEDDVRILMFFLLVWNATSFFSARACLIAEDVMIAASSLPSSKKKDELTVW